MKVEGGRRSVRSLSCKFLLFNLAEKAISLYFSTEKEFAKLKIPRILDMIKNNCYVRRRFLIIYGMV